VTRQRKERLLGNLLLDACFPWLLNDERTSAFNSKSKSDPAAVKIKNKQLQIRENKILSDNTK
jgi:hypothetical protein